LSLTCRWVRPAAHKIKTAATWIVPRNQAEWNRVLTCKQTSFIEVGFSYEQNSDSYKSGVFIFEAKSYNK
jgi:hypothetical protein